jgi:formylglycine-generating enzyme required for sulfatase activity
MNGKSIGDFEIKRIIGEGSLGPVYLAEHKFIKKLFSLKFLPSSLLENSSFRDLFAREISKIAALEHENIASVHNVSSFEDQLFIVSDYIPYKSPSSMNLAAYLGAHKDRLMEGEILQILKEVAFGLDYIHSTNLLSDPLVHGGIKLTNILLEEKKDGSYLIKLSDTGINPMLGNNYVLDHMIKTLSASLDDKTTSVKQKKAFMQSYSFLAPELRFAEEQKFNFKADIYAFGVLTYFLLMGYLPSGYFVMPSSVYKNSSVDWDMIIRSTLCQIPASRADNLTSLIKTATGMVKLEQMTLPKVKTVLTKKEEEEEIIFAAAEKEQEALELAYARLEAKEQEKNSHLSVGSSTSIAQLEKNLMGSLSKTSNVSPMKMTNRAVEKQEPVENPNLFFTKKSEVRTYSPGKLETDWIKPLLTESIEIKKGVYERGSNTGARDEKPRHKVELDGFFIDIHPVTNEQFLRFLMVMEGEKDIFNHDTILLKESRIRRQGGGLTIETGYAKHPVVGVSYYGAKAYAEWAGKRLPTEAEWEVAASGGNAKNIFPVGETIERSEANFFSSDTTPVKSYPPSKNGLYDMAGNVYEWCEDWYDYSYFETSELEPFNPKGPKQGVYRVLRGGCWKSLVDDMRCSHRFRNNPGTMNRTYGFRCVSSVNTENIE